jgi:LPS O-antigen subunit length determinant protein (WzzB/FepE family)
MYWTILKLSGAALIGLLIGWTANGWRLNTKVANIEATYAKAFADAKEQSLQKQTAMQEQADKLRREKDVQIQRIRGSLNIALNSLRNRPSASEQRNTDSSGNGQAALGCTGAELYRENAEDLIGEAARADTIREGLNSCYQQYDSIREVLNSKKGK